MKQGMKRVCAYLLVTVMVLTLFPWNTLKVNATSSEIEVTTQKELQNAVDNPDITTICIKTDIYLSSAIILRQNKQIYCSGNAAIYRSTGNTAEMFVIASGCSVTFGTNESVFLIDGNSENVKANASAICIQEDSCLEMINCTVQNCWNKNIQGGESNWQGGAISSFGTLIMTNCTIQKNCAAWGGGIALYGAYNAIYGCTFTENKAVRGGAIFLNEQLTGDDKVIIGSWNHKKTCIYGNKAVTTNIDLDGNVMESGVNGGHGGGIYNQAEMEITLGQDVEIRENYAEDSGGGICNSKVGSKTSSMILNGTVLKSNKAANGGAIFNSSTLTIADVTCSKENKAYNGGAVYNSPSGSLTIENGMISGTATNNGGGIYNMGYITIKNITLTNSFAVNGGGIYNDTSGEINFKGGIIKNNSCSLNGSGIFQGEKFYLSGTAIVDASNDVYLPENKYIFVDAEINSSGSVATLTPEVYGNGVKLVYDRYHPSAEDVYSNFSLTPNGSFGLNTDGQYIILSADYTVTFDVNGGMELANQDKTKVVTYGKTYGALPTLKWVDDTYKFAGWYTQKEGGTRILARSQVETEGDHTLYAHWTLADTYPYQVYFLDESIIDDPDAKAYMDNDTLEDFSGWEAYRLADPLTVEHAGVKGATISIHDLVLPKVTGWCYSYSYPGDTLTLSMQTNENTFYCLYEREPITYTIRYRNKNTLAEINTETTGTASYGIILQTENLTKPSISGYTYDSTSVEAITMSLDEGANVITLYYTPNEQTYTVEYRSATTDKELKVADTFSSYMDMEVGLSEIEKPLINGYEYSYASVDTLKIGADNSLNKCILYYTPDMTTYQVEYRSVTTDKELKVTDTFPSYVDMTVTLDEITKPEILGYTFKDASEESLTVGYDSSLNRIILYYAPNEQIYTVEYRSAITDKELRNASAFSSYMDLIVSLNEIAKPQIPGYTYKHADKDSLTIACDNTLNKLTLYYAPNLQSYTVEYRSSATGKELKPVSTFSAYMDTVISVNEIHKPDIYGYTYENASVASILMTCDNDQNKITLYYTPNQQTYTVEYRSATTGKILKEADTYSSYMDVELLTDELIKPEIFGYTYQSASKESFVISHVNENNKVTLYYAPDEQIYTVEYRCANTGKALREADTYFSHMDSVIPLYEIEKPEIPGYTYQNANQENLTISYENASNRIILYYAPNVQTYTVEYRSVTTDKVLKPEETFSALMDTTITLHDMKKPQLQGCTFVSASIATLVIGSDNTLNRIILYYEENEYPYIVYYVDEEGNNLMEPKTGQAFLGDWIEESFIPISGYTLLEDGCYSIQISEEENQIVFQYAKILKEAAKKPPVTLSQKNTKTKKEASTTISHTPKETTLLPAPKTGDRTNIWCYVNWLLLGGAGMLFLQYRKRTISRTYHKRKLSGT